MNGKQGKTIRHLRAAYNNAVREGKEQFEIEGMEFYTPYAKYFLEHLKNKGVPEDAYLKNVVAK